MLDPSLLASLLFHRVAAKHESFSKAASELNITQGAVSQRVRLLEDRLGVKLYSRIGRNVTLTDAGAKLLEACAPAFDSIELELHRLESDASSNELCISCIPSFALDWLMPRLESWHAYSGGVRLQLRAEMKIISPAVMLRDRIDIALQYDLGDYDDLAVTTVAPEHLVPVASPELAATARAGSLADFLRTANLIHDERSWDGANPCVEWCHWLKHSGMGDIPCERGDFVNLGHLAIRAALMGSGVAIGRKLLMENELKKGLLVELSDTAVKSPASYQVITQKHPSNPRLVKCFKDWLKDELSRV